MALPLKWLRHKSEGFNTCNVNSPEPIVVKDLQAKGRAFEGTEELRMLTPRRLIRSSHPTESFQPPQQGFFSVHAQLQLLGKIVSLLGI
jgi:hypothetical protein